ncbi:MAG TPA: alpha/beta hydrolase [Acidimicrobiales bacterium]|jgi:pimeloyl-ACP methyl ester carboxylesterase|nr:alpha/beta hydrolase [Acidimicrobiales bacterium]
MATYVLIHGASSDSWYWHRVAPELRRLGHDVVAVDLPCDDDSAGLAEYAATVLEAIGDPTDLIVVAQSLAGFTAPLVCDRVAVNLLILVAAMVPLPGESPREWWANTGYDEAIREQAERDGRSTEGGFDLREVFFHDVPPEVVEEAFARGEKPQSSTPFEKPWPLEHWPDVPTRFLLCRDDRFFPADFLRRVVVERLGIVPDEMDGGHLSALSRPDELVSRLEGYRAGVGA